MKCPYCAEEINDAAIVCRFCNRDFHLVRSFIEKIASLELEANGYRERLDQLSKSVVQVEPPPVSGKWRGAVLIVGAVAISIAGSNGFYWLYNDARSAATLFLSVASPAFGGALIGLRLARVRIVEILALGLFIGFFDFLGTVLIFQGWLWPMPRDWADPVAVMLIGQTLIFTFAYYFGGFIAKRLNFVPLSEGGSERMATALARISHTVNRSSAKDIEFWKTILAGLAPVFTVLGTIVTAYFTYLAALAKH